MEPPQATSSRAVAEHLNTHGLAIRTSPGKGRGVYATVPLAQGTLVEVSPVLLFGPDEWENHGRHTVLDHYTFIWRSPGSSRPSMALALGLGSIFNHSSRPNVSFHRNVLAETIEYTTLRPISTGEELCISYGDSSRLWFPVVDDMAVDTSSEEGEWGGLDGVDLDETALKKEAKPSHTVLGWATGEQDAIVPPADLPFERIKALQELEEDETNGVKTIEAWVVPIPDPRQISSMLRFIKDNGLDTDDLSHLRRIRKVTNLATLLLCPSSSAPPSLPDNLPPPYLNLVPKLPAKDQRDLQRKNLIWPVEPIFRASPERAWTRREVDWVVCGLQKALTLAREGQSRGELPIGAYVCASPGEEVIEATGIDTRQSTNHPLRHSVMAAIRGIADQRVVATSTAAEPALPVTEERLPTPSRGETPDLSATSKNGADYLLTSLTLFTTHEPCIMCSMALVHSRVKDVFYIQGMPGTGGCGGADGEGCGVVGRGVNHRFGVWRWTGGGLSTEELEGMDA